jgi:hypothetical protein
MSLNAELATGTVTTSNVAVITVPAGQLWKAAFITVQQPTGSTAKLFRVGRGTTATAANVKAAKSIPAGLYSDVFMLPFTLAAGQTLDLIVDTGTTELTYTIQGTKDLVT